VQTKISNWVYRLVVVFAFAASLRSAKFAYDMFYEMYAQSALMTDSDVIWLTGLWAALSAPILLLLISLALVLRSGAALWLLAWYFLSEAVPVLISIFNLPFGGALILALITVLVVTLILVGLFVFLIRSGELRKP